MVKAIYAGLGKVAHILASPLLQAYPKHHKRVRVLVLNHNHELLLVRSWFGYQRWSLPGGGIKHMEDPKIAASREVHEETRIRVHPKRLRRLGWFTNNDSRAPFTIDCYIAVTDNQPAYITILRRLEILEVAWFPMRRLPKVRSAVVDRALELYRSSS